MHDLNNALNAIVGFADLALQVSPDSETGTELEQIRASGLRAASLGRRILDRTRKADVSRGGPPGRADTVHVAAPDGAGTVGDAPPDGGDPLRGPARQLSAVRAIQVHAPRGP